MIKKHYHFIGVGGIGMGGLALLVQSKGGQVSGSDLCQNRLTDQLKAHGATITQGHAAENIAGADVVVRSSAIRPDNIELKTAREQGVPVMQRAELLAELMDGSIAITIAGAHGKTTTTSMVSNMLEYAQLKPTTAVGGLIQGTGKNAHLGEGPYFVAEVDESDGSFLNFYPQYSIITNVDWEHVDHYPDWNSIERAYAQFIQQTQSDGIVIGCGDNEHLKKLLDASDIKSRLYGLGTHNAVRAENIKPTAFGSIFEYHADGKYWGDIELKIPGQHNVINALACVSLGLELSIGFDVIRNSFLQFRGVHRRFELKAQKDNITIIDDYGHHPSEIQATLQTARLLSFKRLVVAFQPHRYTRTQFLFDDFIAALRAVDHLIITDIYAASESPIAGVSAEKLAQAVRQAGGVSVEYCPKGDVYNSLLAVMRPGDCILTLGAGDITAVSDQLAAALANSSQTV